MEYLLIKELDNSYDRPVTSISNDNEKIEVLMDTGANVPVWVSGEDALKKAFKGVEELTNYEYWLSGFGNGIEIAKEFKIEEIVIKSDYSEDHIKFKNVILACCKKEHMGVQSNNKCNNVRQVQL